MATPNLIEYTDGMFIRSGPGSWDGPILRMVALQDEYGVRGLLKPDDIVLDIGAHIGSFSYLAYKLGVRPENIYAFEAFPENFEIAVKNLAGRGIHVSNAAVWSESGLTRQYDGPAENTGGGNVFWHHFSSSVKMTTVSLDDILEHIEYNGQSAHNNGPNYHEAYKFPGVRMLKIDCETSEFPILLSSRRIRDIQSIVGEYHETADIPDDAQPKNGIKYKAYTSDVLKQWLESNGFQVTIIDRASVPGGNALGHFRAERV